VCNLRVNRVPNRLNNLLLSPHVNRHLQYRVMQI
jgi:hypothetical protein